MNNTQNEVFSIKVNELKQYLLKQKNTILIAVLIIFYSVGTVGTQLPAHRAFFLGLSDFNLLLTFVIALLAFEKLNLKEIFFLVICYLATMSAEWIGTSTGLLFGSYFYGQNLGETVVGVPLVIGLNWWILIIAASSITDYFKLKPLVSALVGALLMTLLDVIMEPVAIKSDFWHWENEQIPMYNYVCWFLLTFILLVIKEKVSVSKANKVHSALFLIITLFFIIQLLF